MARYPNSAAAATNNMWVEKGVGGVASPKKKVLSQLSRDGDETLSITQVFYKAQDN